MQARRQMLEEERRRREEAERRLQDETAHRQRLVEEEVKMREKQFSQVSGTEGGDGRREEKRGEETRGEERRGGVRRLGGKDERRDTKERLGICEDQRLSRKGETGETMEGRVERERVEEQRESYYWRWCENDIHIIQALIPADYQCLSASVTADSMRNTSRSGCCELQALI